MFPPPNPNPNPNCSPSISPFCNRAFQTNPPCSWNTWQISSRVKITFNDAWRNTWHELRPRRPQLERQGGHDRSNTYQIPLRTMTSAPESKPVPFAGTIKKRIKRSKPVANTRRRAPVVQELQGASFDCCRNYYGCMERRRIRKVKKTTPWLSCL